MSVAVDDVILTTEKCSLRPYFAKPGFSCADNQFTCKNGECVKKNLKCDGDLACQDGSDEDDCRCSSTMFQCQEGRCILATAMCDGRYDCYNGDDERSCQNPCPSSHQCLDGSCVSWSNTCSQTPFCRDGTNTPSVCESGKCHLNDLACLSKNSSEHRRCRSFRGHCSFQNENCGLKTDKNATFHWTVGSGETPTENTGPSYDHTSFDKDGLYIFTEASHKNPGDKAWLLSGWKEPSETVCVQFWYHMHGSDIGNLSIYLKTNQSETLVWRSSGDQGNRWRFGQTALNSQISYRFVLEGTVGNGSKGDIALDDLTILDGICEMIKRQASPDCDFEEDNCDWEAREGWILDRQVKGFEKSGGFVASLPAGGSELPSSLSSPIINTKAYEWKCLRFWYFIGSDHANDWHTASLMVLLRQILSNQTVLLFFVDEVTNKARYTQIPLPSNYTNAKIDFVGWSKSSSGPFIAIDDVSFSKETCRSIPWKTVEEQLKCQKAFGMENGAISDGQIRASSWFGARHAAYQGRLHRVAGCWAAYGNDANQWLQVHLGSDNTEVTRVATQGRSDYPQWVTKYKLQYSKDGMNFPYYKEQGKTADKDFTGNTDQDTVVYHELRPPIRARYIRFRPIAWHNHISMRVELYGCREECHGALGMKNGAIFDAQITASSQFDANHAAIQGRLDFREIPKRVGSWSAARNDLQQWLQIYLGSQNTKVTRVATQGRNDAEQWVTKYKLQYSNNGVNFQYYRDQGQTTDKIFNGNSDQDTVVWHTLNSSITARYIRFRPEAWHGHISMRVELYGCQEGNVGECHDALGMQSGAISDAQIRASTQWDASHAATQGRLHCKVNPWKPGSWTPARNDPHPWLQIDLVTQYTKVTRVATQGRNSYSWYEWVTRYKLQFSNDEVKFQYYREQGQTADKVFAGNTDRDTVVFHDLNPPIRAQFIRFRPIAWFRWISMRVELYGCQECQETLGMENGAIPDEQISVSSQLDANHSAVQGRLQCEAGSWSAGSNDVNQWLQIDLGSQYTEVSRLATQGRSDAAQWVTSYKLRYSNDGVNFQYYREQGQTADKVFVGNTDNNIVVYHELIPPIRARYIRFRPAAWHNHISMRVELYGCRDHRPCDISVDWCGWKSMHGWKQIRYKELDQGYQEDGDNEEDEKDGGDYEIHLPDIDLGYVSFSDISPLHLGFTMCFWLKTAYSGFFIEYNLVTKQNETLLLGVYCHNNIFRTQLGNQKSEVAMGVADDTWHQVCLSWEADSGLLSVFKDGKRKSESYGYWSSSRNQGIEGSRIMTIGFRAPSKNASVVLGKLSGFNVWSHVLLPEEIQRMSHGCGTEAGDAKAWETVRKWLQKEVAVKWFRTCKDRKGDRLVVDTNDIQFYQTAVLASRPYNRSRDWHSRCLRFRFMLRGPGEKRLTIYQKTNSYREIPIWISGSNTGPTWSYGQVPLSSVLEFQVLIKGEKEIKEGLIALTGLYIDEEKNCKHKPLMAKQACSENLLNTSGYFFSPSFPGYYLDDMFCTWHITVPSRYTIHLELQEFRLKDHPTCEDCFLQIFDGRDRTAPAIGKYCGYTYPTVFISSSNHLTIVLYCHGKLHGTRFKAFYHSIAADDDTGLSCSHQEGCPPSCKCEVFGEDPDQKIVVTGEDLLTVPSNLPSNTGAVFFQQNRISHLREKNFANLTKLEYIDMSFNVLFHLDEDCFQNVSSVKTLRLNSNFLRTLPVGALTGLPYLRVLDLGRNLLRKAVSGVFDGLSNLEVLSMRSNQLTELEHGVFDKQGNMTYLYLQDNMLTALPDGLFGALSKLKLLNLSSNELRTVTKETFQGLKSLEYMYLDRNKLYKIPADAFSELTNLKYLKLDRFILCCYAKKTIVGVECESPVDEFSSCDDLMKNKALQICIWILGILGFAGNLLVIIWRIIDKEENRVHSFLLTNLAVADMFMGVYMMTIAIMDLRWQGEYFKHDIEWRSGIGCKIAGALSMLSSEVSVLILTIITLDRLISIVFPFKFKRLTNKAAVFACTGVWIFGVAISVIPITGISYFYGYESASNFGFYSRSAVCLPLQLSEGTPAGWEYSVAFFVGLNFISFTFILIAYISMFWTVKRVSRAVRSTNLNKESAMAKRLVFIVMTDFCCWMPIIIINILSLTGNFEDPNKIAYVWIAVFVLPLNSSLNPILYTFSTKRTKRSLTRKRKKVTGFVLQMMKISGSDTKRQPVHWREASGDNTIVSNVNAGSSPVSLSPTSEIKERENKQVQVKLRLIEQVNILQDDTEEKRSTGYATAWCEEGNIASMVLLKYFGKELKEDWDREADIIQGLSCGEDPHANLLYYRWHSKARDQSIEGNVKIRDLTDSNSFLICYDFVSSSTLKDFLCEKGIILNFDAVCAIACDVISAIERLQDHGILHNSITTNNILIGQCPRLPPIRAVLGGFSRASKMNDSGAFKNVEVDGQSNCGNDIQQFGQLLATLLGYCYDSCEYIKLHEIMNLCFEEMDENRPKASYIRELLEEAWCIEGVWDTCL
ncbi:uncharacterized protein LOC144641914 [Oculina patagonica]